MNRIVLITSIVIITIIAGFIITIEIHKTVNIVFENEVSEVDFWGFKTRDALAASDITFHEGDIIIPNLDENISENETVVILPAFWVRISADGKSHNLWTAERSLEKILGLASISLNPGDQIWSNGLPIEPSSSLSYAPTYSLQVRRQTSVSLDINGETQTIRSIAYTLGEALSEANIQIHAVDQLYPPADTPLKGQDIHAVIESSREVTIKTREKVIQTLVLAATVGEALTKAGVPLQGLDYSIPGEIEPVPDDGHIRVVQVREDIQLEQDPIPFSTQFQPVAQIDLDNQQIVQVGEYGILARQIRVVYEDDQEISQNIEEEWIAKDPKPRIIGYGTKVTIRNANTPDGPIQYWRAVEAYATSYSPCRIGLQNQCSNYTASGAELKKGVIGVIRSWYNKMRGLTVYIPGYGYGTIEDIGGGFPDRHWIDLGYSDEDWVNWSGSVTVYFVPPVPANIMYILE